MKALFTYLLTCVHLSSCAHYTTYGKNTSVSDPHTALTQPHTHTRTRTHPPTWIIDTPYTVHHVLKTGLVLCGHSRPQASSLIIRGHEQKLANWGHALSNWCICITTKIEKPEGMDWTVVPSKTVSSKICSLTL